MAYIDWSEEFSVGIPSIDAQHQRLLMIINQLHEAMINRQTREAMGRILDELLTYTRTHFRFEEEYLARFGFPDLDEHHGLHEALVERVLDYRQAWRNDQPLPTRQVLAFLREWWSTHIMESDMEYSLFLRNHGAK